MRHWIFVFCLALGIFWIGGAKVTFARGSHSRSNKVLQSRQALRDLSEARYEDTLIESCSKHERDRANAAANNQIQFFSEECMPIEVSRRKIKRTGELKHFSRCEENRQETIKNAAAQLRIYLVPDCFNFVPDRKMEIAMKKPIDPIFQNPPPGVWKSAIFMACDNEGNCTAISRKP